MLTDDYIVRACRYIVDFLKLQKTDSNNNVKEIAKCILQRFNVKTSKRNFIFEMPGNVFLQYLNLKLVFIDRKRVCWSYSRRTNRALLSLDASHAKLVTRGIAIVMFKVLFDQVMSPQSQR